MEFRFAQRMEGITGNAIREIFALLRRPEIISLAGGNPAPSSFPSETIARLTAELLEKDGKTILQYGGTSGYEPLIESAVGHVRDVGVVCSQENVMVVSGGQQAIDLVCKSLIDPGDVVLFEKPTYLAALHILKTYQGVAVAVETDENGINVIDLEAKIRRFNPKFLYLVPTFQNPTGRTMSLERRKQVGAVTARYGLPVLEDDPYRELRYRGEALPAIKSFDQMGNVIYICSFSKVISPGLRVGVVVADPAILRKMIIGKQATDVHTNNLAQALVDAFIRQNLLKPHIASILPTYREQLKTMMDGFSHFPDWVRHTNPEGGLFVWCTLPDGFDCDALLKKAVERNVAFVPGASFHPDGGKNTLRLNFSMNPPERIARGMETLGKVLREA